MLERDSGIASARRSAAAFIDLIEERIAGGAKTIEARRALDYAKGILGDLDQAAADDDAPVYYSTSDVAAKLNASVAWIRRLAEREQIGVKRATGGQGSRTYSKADLDKLREILGSASRGRPRENATSK